MVIIVSVMNIRQVKLKVTANTSTKHAIKTLWCFLRVKDCQCLVLLGLGPYMLVDNIQPPTHNSVAWMQGREP